MFGFGTWDGNGVYNNTGLVPVNVVGYQQLADGQLNATIGFNVPAGYSLRFIAIPLGNINGGDNRRQIYVSGNSVVSVSAPNNVAGPDRFPSLPLFIIGYAV